jgi:lipoate-protein ligase A
MAKDQVCLERAAREGRAALRLYQWERLVLSVGRAQQVQRQIDLDACRAAGVPLVRRATGGRAVLHGSDLTYAVAAPTALPGFGGGILSVYRSLSRVFVRFLRSLALEPQVQVYAGRERAALASAICFSTPSAFEILVGGRKLVGSAQRLVPGAFLQHGSLPLAPQAALLAGLFHGTTAEAVQAQMTDLDTLGAHLPEPLPGPEGLRERLAAAFAAELGIVLEPAAWGEAEEAAVRALLPRYAPLDTADKPPAPATPPRVRAQ